MQLSACLSMICCGVANRFRRLAPQKVWGKGSESETDQSDGDDVEKGASRDKHGVVHRSGKLLVLKQLLPLWHTQVGLAGARVVIEVSTSCQGLGGVGPDVYCSRGAAALIAESLHATIACACEDRALGPS